MLSRLMVSKTSLNNYRYSAIQPASQPTSQPASHGVMLCVWYVCCVHVCLLCVCSVCHACCVCSVCMLVNKYDTHNIQLGLFDGSMGDREVK